MLRHRYLFQDTDFPDLIGPILLTYQVVVVSWIVILVYISLMVTLGGEYTPHVHCDWGVYFTEDVIVAMTTVIIVYSAVTLTFHICILVKVKAQHARRLNLGMDSSPCRSK